MVFLRSQQISLVKNLKFKLIEMEEIYDVVMRQLAGVKLNMMLIRMKINLLLMEERCLSRMEVQQVLLSQLIVCSQDDSGLAMKISSPARKSLSGKFDQFNNDQKMED